MIRMDTAYAEWQGARAAGAGTLGWAAPHRGEMAFTLVADSLIGFDSLLLAVTGQQRDTSSGHAVLGGAARGTVRLSGSIDTLEATGDVTVGELVFQQYRSPRLTGGFSWTGGRRPQLTASAVADTVIAGEWAFSRNSLSVAGYVDSLGWNVGTTAGARRGWTPPGAGGCATASTRSGSTPCRPRCPPTAIACSSPRPSPWTACRRSRRWRCRRWTAPVWCASPGACRRRRPARCRSRCSDWS